MTNLGDLFAPEVPDELRPWADRESSVNSYDGWKPETVAWMKQGVVHAPALIPEALMDNYCAAFEAAEIGDQGWGAGTAYMHVPELLALCMHPPLLALLALLVGEPMGLHLNLTKWVSTERDWHADCYLNPPEVDGWYAATWVALEDIHPDSGPFQYVPGSHRWPPLSRQRVIEAGGLNPSDPDWPRHSEALLTPLYEAKIHDEGLTVVTPTLKRGDVLVWHSRLLHRGSTPRVPGTRRKAVISHYSGVNHRPDMPNRRTYPGGGTYMVF